MNFNDIAIVSDHRIDHRIQNHRIIERIKKYKEEIYQKNIS